MSRKKKRAVRARKVKSHGLWIRPDLERTIKGEGGRRGLSDPPYSYYLQLADLVLGPSPETPAAGKQSERDREEFSVSEHQWARRSSPEVLPSPERGIDSIRLTPMPVARPTKRAKLTLPKPKSAKIAKLGTPKPPKRPSTPKLSLPKPPKRKR